jgi:hypothetical protein
VNSASRSLQLQVSTNCTPLFLHGLGYSYRHLLEMSFGFGVGDFLAVAQLAERLYKEIYLVARHASHELLQLQSEVATLSMSINLLVAELQDKNSVLARSGKERVETVRSVLKATKNTLLDLESFSKGFQDSRKSGALKKIRLVWNKAKFATDMPKIDALRARLQYQNGTINLLLVSAGKYVFLEYIKWFVLTKSVLHCSALRLWIVK